MLKNELVYSANARTNNLTLIDEREQLQDLGYTTFNSSRNFTDLYIDNYSGDVYFSDANNSDNKILINYSVNSSWIVGDPNKGYVDELFYKENHIPVPIQDRNIKPLAIEKVSKNDDGVPSWADGGHILIGLDQQRNIVGIIFDSTGNYLLDIGNPKDSYGQNQAENIFGFDLNKDGKQAGLSEEDIDPNPNPIVPEPNPIEGLPENINKAINLKASNIDWFNSIWGPGSNGINLEDGSGGLNYSTETNIGWYKKINGIHTTAFSLQSEDGWENDKWVWVDGPNGWEQPDKSTDFNFLTHEGLNNTISINGQTNSYIQVINLNSLETVAFGFEEVSFKPDPSTRYGGFAWYANNKQAELEINALSTRSRSRRGL